MTYNTCNTCNICYVVISILIGFIIFDKYLGGIDRFKSQVVKKPILPGKPPSNKYPIVIKPPIDMIRPPPTKNPIIGKPPKK